MSFFDFNFLPLVWCHPTAFQLAPEAVDEPGPNCFSLNSWEFLPTYQFQMCVDRYQGNRYVKVISPAGIRLLCLVLCSGSTLSRKPSRYRSLSPCSATQALSHGFPGTGFSQHVGTRQRTPRLADLRRFRPSLDCRRSRSLPRRIFGVELSETVYALDSTTIDLCLVAFPVGEVPPPQECGETAHAAGSAGQHSDQCLCDRRPSSRREHFGPVASRKPERLTCSIAVMWTSLACMSWPKLALSSSLAPKRICSSTVAAHVPSNDRQDCR